MSKVNLYETELLAHVFQNAAIALIGDATGVRGSTVAGSLYVSLHTADPGEAGDQTTSEVAYGSYARQAVARASGAGGWNVSGNAANNVDAITFPLGTSGSVVNATHFGVGTSVSGAGKLLYKGLITSPAAGIPSGNAIQPILSATTGVVVTED